MRLFGNLILFCAVLLVITKAQAQLCRPGVDADAEHYYQLAKQAPYYEQRLFYLNQAEAICQSFQIAVNKGESLLYLQRFPAAIQALQEAKALVSHHADAKARLYTLLGAAYYHNNQLVDARIHSEIAYDLYRLDLDMEIPELLHGTLTALDDRDLHRIVPKYEIGRLLAAKKGAGILPAIDVRIHFDFDKANLSNVGLKQTKQLSLALLPFLEAYDVLLIGHTDQRGTEAYNMQLSIKRASTVAEYLSEQYPEYSSQFNIRGKGKSQLRYNGKSEQDHRRNRRVEINLVLRK